MDNREQSEEQGAERRQSVTGPRGHDDDHDDVFVVAETRTSVCVSVPRRCEEVLLLWTSQLGALAIQRLWL